MNLDVYQQTPTQILGLNIKDEKSGSKKSKGTFDASHCENTLEWFLHIITTKRMS